MILRLTLVKPVGGGIMCGECRVKVEMNIERRRQEEKIEVLWNCSATN